MNSRGQTSLNCEIVKAFCHRFVGSELHAGLGERAQPLRDVSPRSRGCRGQEIILGIDDIGPDGAERAIRKPRSASVEDS